MVVARCLLRRRLWVRRTWLTWALRARSLAPLGGTRSMARVIRGSCTHRFGWASGLLLAFGVVPSIFVISLLLELVQYQEHDLN